MPAKRILLVEDEHDVARMLSLALLAEGYELDVADTAARAGERLGGIRYDLVIADHRLPDGNGLDIADRAADEGTKTLLVSGFLFLIPAGQAARHEVLMKPVRSREIVEVVERLIGRATDPEPERER